MGSHKRGSLIEETAENLLEMITVEKKFQAGDKLPNENELSSLLNVSRGTLREAVRILATQDILQIERGKGTFITPNGASPEKSVLDPLAKAKTNLKDLMEMRLIIEPEAAFIATNRSTDREIERIVYHGEQIQQKLLAGDDRTEDEQLFHNAITKATHNDFMKNLMPIVNQAIYKGVLISKQVAQVNELTLNDHRMIMEFIKAHNAEGAKIAMKLHILHAIDAFGIKMDS